MNIVLFQCPELIYAFNHLKWIKSLAYIYALSPASILNTNIILKLTGILVL